MSDPNQPPSYPGGEQPPPPPQQPPAYPQYPAEGYPQQYGQQYGPQNGPQYGQPGYGPQYGQQYGPPYGQPTSPYAHWGLRLAAYLLDSLLTIPAIIVVEIGSAMVDDDSLTSDTQTIGLVLMLVGLVPLIWFSIWNQIIRQGRTGSSLGKKWVGIAVISEQTQRPIGGWPTFGRSLLHILDALPCYLGYLWPLWDDKKQTFADKIMKTVVVPIAKTPPPAPQPTPWQAS